MKIPVNLLAAAESTNSPHPHLEVAHIGSEAIVATNRVTMVVHPLSKGPEKELIITRDDIDFIASGEEISYIELTDDFHLSHKENTRELSEATEPFPEWQNLIPPVSHSNIKITLDSDYLLNLIQALGGGAITLHVADESSPIRIESESAAYGVIVPRQVENVDDEPKETPQEKPIPFPKKPKKSARTARVVKPVQTTKQPATKATVQRNEKRNGIEIVFDGIPEESIREQMSSKGFHYSRRKNLWYTRYSEDKYTFAQSIEASYPQQVAV